MKKQIIVSFIVILALILCIPLFASSSGSIRTRRKLNLGNQYLDELKYEEALALFQEVINIDPKNVDAYLGVVETYIRQNDFETGLNYARMGYENTGDERLQKQIEMIENRPMQEAKAEQQNKLSLEAADKENESEDYGELLRLAHELFDDSTYPRGELPGPIWSRAEYIERLSL